MLMLLWIFFNILNRAAIYIDHYLAGGGGGGWYLISSAYSFFFFSFIHTFQPVGPNVRLSETMCRTHKSTMSTQGQGGWGKGVVYLTSPGRPTDIDLQLANACYPCRGVGGGGRVFLFLLFLHCHSFSFFHCPSRSFPLLSLLSPFLWETIQNGPQGLTYRLTPTQSIKV